MLEAVGIGDLHLDSRGVRFIPNLNRVICDEVRAVLKAARRRGVSLAFLYGDICDRALMSYEAHIEFLTLLKEFEDFRFFAIKGNHDATTANDTGQCSLDLLHYLGESQTISNLRVIRHAPKTFFRSQGTPVRFVPWPGADTEPDVLNVLHVEAAGAKWDTGRPVKAGLNTKHLCVIGHIHTAQVVRNSHFSGTLFQTNFGEAPEKFFHYIRWDGDVSTASIKLVPHTPKYTLLNSVVKSRADYKQLRKDVEVAGEYTLWKVFVHSGSVVLPESAFDDMPTVVRTNSFRTPEELTALIHEELNLDAVDEEQQVNTTSALELWMDKNEIDPGLRRRVYKKLKELTGKDLSEQPSVNE